MTAISLPAPLRGIVPPMVTPLSNDDELENEGLRRLVEHLVAGGVHGLFVLGTTGEGLSLSHRIRRELIDKTCEIVAGRVPVLVAVTDTSMQESVALAEFATGAGANAVVLAPPIYYPHEQSELVSCAEALAERSSLPVMLYNIPALTKIPYDPQTVAHLSAHPNIIGIKDSSGDLDYFQAIRDCTADRDGWTLLTGHDLLLGQTIPIGAHGGVCGGANVFPQLFVDLYNSVVRHDHDRAADLQASLVKLSELYRVRGNSSLGAIRGIKCALDQLGVCSGRMAAPSRGLPESCAQQVRDILAGFGEQLATILY